MALFRIEAYACDGSKLTADFQWRKDFETAWRAIEDAPISNLQAVRALTDTLSWGATVIVFRAMTRR